MLARERPRDACTRASAPVVSTCFVADMSKQTHSFQAEVKQILHLVTHSLYSNKEIFLRELISNASDACDKLRFEALDKPELYESQTDLQVKVAVDKDSKTIT